MRRQHHSEKYELSDAEKRDLIKLINEGKPLPEKYRFLLFEDKREVELVWNGKTREVSPARRAERASEAEAQRGEFVNAGVSITEITSGRLSWARAWGGT